MSNHTLEAQLSCPRQSFLTSASCKRNFSVTPYCFNCTPKQRLGNLIKKFARRDHRTNQHEVIAYDMRGSKHLPLPGQGPQRDRRVRRLERGWQQKTALSKTAFRSEQNYDDHCTVVVAISVRS